MSARPLTGTIQTHTHREATCVNCGAGLVSVIPTVWWHVDNQLVECLTKKRGE